MDSREGAGCKGTSQQGEGKHETQMCSARPLAAAPPQVLPDMTTSVQLQTAYIVLFVVITEQYIEQYIDIGIQYIQRKNGARR